MTLDVALDIISVSAASQQVAAAILERPEWACIVSSSPQPLNVWPISNLGHVSVPQLTMTLQQH